MTLSKLAVGKPTTVLLISIILTALGIYSALKLPIDLYPDMELPYMIVSSSYPNAGPEEVERSLTRPLESAVSSVTGLKNFSSTSSFGSSLIMIELNYGTNLDAAANEIRDRLELIKNVLPSDATSPTIIKADPSMIPIMSLVVTGSRTPEELHRYATDIIQPRLEQVDGVASANVSGGRERAIRIEIPRDRLEAYSLTIGQVVQMLGTQNVQTGGGRITEGDLNYTVMTSGQYASLDDIRNTVISYKTTDTSAGTIPELRTVRVRDIADVYDGFKPETSLAYMNGVPSVMLTVQKQSGKNSVQTTRRVREQMKTIEKTLPADVEIVETMNTSDIIESSISQVRNSAIQGALLAVLVLFLFLRSLKSTAIIGITIPVSLIVTLGIMYFMGFTLNLMTLSGLALGVGMLVDNSIVILENIYSYRERGAKAVPAAVLGSQEMITAITASTLTTICVFLPLVMYSSELGVLAQIFNSLTFTIVISLLCSLVIAVVLVPVLASKYLKLERGNANRLGPLSFIDGVLANFFTKMDNAYAGAVKKVLKHKALFLIVLAGLFVGSVIMIPIVGFVFMPTQTGDSVAIKLEMPKGTRLEATESVVRQMEEIAMRELKGVKTTTVSVGGGDFFSFQAAQANSATLNIKLSPFAERKPGDDTDITAKEKMRAYFNRFPGAVFSFQTNNSMNVSGGGVDVIISSDDLDKARTTANAIVALLNEKAADYINEPASDLQDGLPRLNIRVNREKMYNLGLNIYSVSNEIKANVNGQTAGRYSTGGEEVDILVTLNEKDREKRSDLESIFVTNANGKRIPLASFAEWEEGTSPVSINRENQRRTIHVKAQPVFGKPITEVQRAVERIILENIPADDGVRITYGGDYKELMNALKQLAIIIFMAVILVFAVMASQFESFSDPFIIIFTIPLSLIGIVALYLICRSVFNALTVVGLLILVGVIVNNGIVLVDYTNLLRKRGLALEEACVEAARSRLRPILMTTLTTVFGLIPMAFGAGEGAEMVQPIGQTVLGGLSFGTLMTLFLMPVLYYIFNGRREKRLAKKLARKQQKMSADLAKGNGEAQ